MGSSNHSVCSEAIDGRVRLFAQDLLEVLSRHPACLMQGRALGIHVGVGEELHKLMFSLAGESGSGEQMQAALNVMPLDVNWNKLHRISGVSAR